MKSRVNVSAGSSGIILSVSMIVKNEEKYLGECLSAIKPLLDAVPSELIIVDTGSEDKTVEIAKSYTDKVLHFDWINDFSAARNFGLKQCKGEWFMFLDADDHFDSDLSEMISFFNNAKMRSEYNSAYYITHNFTKTDGIHSDLYVQRIAKIMPSLHFAGRIHEVFEGFYRPSYYFNTFANHWGYLADDPKDVEAKTKRNLDLLYEELKENPNDVRRICQVIDCLSPKKEADEYVYRALELWKNDSTPYAYVKPYMAAINHFAESDPQKTADYCCEYIKIADKNEAHLIDAYGYKTLALYTLKRYSECIEALDKYLEYYDLFKNDKLKKEPMIFCVVNYLDESKHDYITGIASISLALEERFEEAYLYFGKAYDFGNKEFYGKISPELYKEAINALRDIAKRQQDFKRLSEYYNAAYESGEKEKLVMLDAMLERLYFESQDRAGFAASASEYKGKGFFALMGIISGKLDLQPYLDEMSVEINGRNACVEALYLAFRDKADLSEFLKKLDRETIESLIEVLSNRFYYEYARLTLQYCTLDRFSVSIKHLCFAVSALEKAVATAGNLEKEEKSRLYTRFMDATAVYAANIYNPALLNDEDIYVLPPSHRFGYAAAKCKDALKAGNVAEYIHSLKYALMVCPGAKDVVSFLLDDILG